MILPEPKLRHICHTLLLAAGAPEHEARVVADELTEASLMGIDSHGFMRLAQYLHMIKGGHIQPGAPQEVVHDTPVSAILDGHFNFGMVTAREMARLAVAKARACHIAVVASRRCRHVGRLGSFTRQIAREGFFAFATASGATAGQMVAPFCGAGRRLCTNPLSYAVPTAGDPVILDMSTSAIAEGKIRLLLQQGKPLPDDCVLDPEGRPTNDPARFYDPPGGLILPFGGALGYKGFGLSLLVEILGRALSGAGACDDYDNSLFLLAINPAILGAADTFVADIEAIKRHILSCPSLPGAPAVTLPGGLDFATRQARLQNGIPVSDATWSTIVAAAQCFGVKADEISERGSE